MTIEYGDIPLIDPGTGKLPPQFIPDTGGSASFPPGGATGEALVKASGADDDVEWKTLEPSDIGAYPAGSVVVDTSVGTRVTIGGVMVYGVSGPRNIISLLESGFTASSVRTERRTDVLELYYDSLKYTGLTGAWVKVLTLPVGFRPAAGSTWETATERFQFAANGNLHVMSLSGTRNLNVTALQLRLPASTWPSSLPGVPV